MPNSKINPAGLYDAVGYGFSHAALQDGGRTLHLAGQVAWDKDCNVVGGDDLAAQTRQALANLEAVLAEVGATPADVVRLRTYVVDHNPDKLGPVLAEVGAFYDGVLPAPNTFIGVQALALPDFLVEIEATAVIG
ncbi:MAG: RidA family protein [Sphingopyxis macrogoltabida]|uniref:RidA family protein n=1 Tax=Sphingopyxis macrogoltabida TaxID=33050 RepID=A0A2W5MRB8_SPHMC|nr:MAG: RidA family protein [Sphingopyxis macrogoltabida]